SSAPSSTVATPKTSAPAANNARLRAAGIRVPIVVLGLAQPGEAAAVIRHKLQPTVTSEKQIRALSREAQRARTRVAVHLKVDTGMGRIGLSADAAPNFIKRLSSAPGIQLAGVFTHFAHADGRDLQLLNLQMQRLQAVTRALDASVLVHAANSAAVINAPQTHASMVRPGLMLYGLYPAPNLRTRVSLQPALSWKTRIIELKTVRPGTGLSYGHTYVTRRTSRIATLPVGYADGFSRALSNLGQVLIGGKLCPVVGRVCMDMCLVDVSRVPNAAVGDEVVLIGRQGQASLPAEDMAARLETITYEIVCTIGSRVPRLYRGGGQ
ncbi:MAG: alanine racemase, partial [Candidatus Firestonebacteria bacterium]|nr:alanine racemase [Candidatus Firestonebacteria bacterium]